MALDEPNAAYLDRLKQSGLPDMRDVPIARYRLMLADLQSRRPPGPAVGSVEDLAIAGPGGDLPVRLYVPEGPLTGIMVYLHGGGWTVGDIEGWDPMLRRLATVTSSAIASVGYRLAPEHRFPAAFDDAVVAAIEIGRIAARRWPHLPLILAGDSAGAGLAAAAALLLRDRPEVHVAMQILAYPVVSADLEASSLREFVPPRLTLEELAWYRDQYAPDPSCWADPRLSPFAAADVTDLPPTLIMTAENDILRGQGEAYALKLAAAGVAVVVRRHPGTMHGFLTIGDAIPQSGAGMADIARFIRGGWATKSSRRI